MMLRVSDFPAANAQTKKEGDGEGGEESWWKPTPGISWDVSIRPL